MVKSNDISNLFSAQVAKEFETFQQAKAIELKDSLAAYTDAHVEFYKEVGLVGRRTYFYFCARSPIMKARGGRQLNGC